MFDLKNNTDKEIIEKVSAEIIKNHLGWSGSQERKPSEAPVVECILGKLTDAFREVTLHNLGQKFDELEDPELFLMVTRETSKKFFNRACDEADTKWESAKTTLGI